MNNHIDESGIDSIGNLRFLGIWAPVLYLLGQWYWLGAAGADSEIFGARFVLCRVLRLGVGDGGCSVLNAPPAGAVGPAVVSPFIITDPSQASREK